MKTLIIFCILFVSIKTIAQLEKKTWLLGGSGAFSSTSYSPRQQLAYGEGKYIDFRLSANAGYFFLDKLAVGVSTSMYNRKSNLINNAYQKANGFAGGPFIRYYFLNKEKPFNFLVDYNYQLGKINDLGSSSDAKISLQTISGGIEFFFNTSVGMEILLGYSNRTEKFEDGNEKKNGLITNISFQFHLIK